MKVEFIFCGVIALLYLIAAALAAAVYLEAYAAAAVSFFYTIGKQSPEKVYPRCAVCAGLHSYDILFT